MLRMFSVLTIIGLICGCDVVEPDMKMSVQRPQNVVEKTERFSITRVGVFEDQLAYNGKRGVYIIRDNQTEREWIGISGINELGQHTEGGKHPVEVLDER